MYKFFLIILFCCFQQGIHAAEISTRDRVLTQWEEALTSQNKEALPDLINNSSVAWPCLFSLESAETDAEQKLRRRSLSVANNVHAFLRRRLENVANRSPEGLLQTARYAALTRRNDGNTSLVKCWKRVVAGLERDDEKGQGRWLSVALADQATRAFSRIGATRPGDQSA